MQLFPPEACTDGSCLPVRVHGRRRSGIQLWEEQGSVLLTQYCFSLSSAGEKGSLFDSSAISIGKP